MASRFITPLFDAGNGISPSDGAQLFFFITGTADLKNTFSDEAATTPNPNPVIADGDGVFPEIWITGRYKVVLKDKNGVQKREEDPVEDVLLTSDLANNTDAAKGSDLLGHLLAGLTGVTNFSWAVNDAINELFNRAIFATDPRFGAVNGVESTVNIQAAIDYAKSTGDPFPSVCIGYGNFTISSQLDRTGNGVYVDIFGFGQRNTTLIVDAVATPFNSVLRLATSTDIVGRTMIRDMTIDCTSVADYGIDAQNMRSWTLQNVEFKNAVIAGCKAGNWSTDILNNKFDSCPIGFFLKGLAASPTSVNGFKFQNNYVVDCPIGFKSDVALMNDLSVTDNLFDTCIDAGVWIQFGTRNGTIDRNYFEKCGKTGSGVVVAIAGPSIESIAAPIVLGYDPTAVTATTFTGSVDKNFFVDNNATRLIAAYNVQELSVKDNGLRNSDSIAAFLELREEGSANGQSGGVTTAGYYPGVTQMVALNGLSAANNHHNLVIDTKELPANTLPKFFINNPTLGMFTGATTIIETFYGGIKEFEFDVITDTTSIDRIMLIDFTTLTDHPLLGRYVRVHYSTKGSAGDSAVRCRISVSGVTILDIQNSGATYIAAGRGRTVFIPAAATSFEVRLDGLSNSVNSKMIGFTVCDAAYPVASVPIAQA